MNTHPSDPSHPPSPVWLAGAACVGASLAVALLLLVRPTSAAGVDALEAEVVRLETQLAEACPESEPSPSSAREVPVDAPAPEPGLPVEDPGPSQVVAIPEAVLDAAVEAEIRRRKTVALEAARHRATTEGAARIGEAVDALAVERGLSDHDAADVEVLLYAELEQVWELKGQVAQGELDDKQGWHDYEQLRADSDVALLELLDADELTWLRQRLETRSPKQAD